MSCSGTQSPRRIAAEITRQYNPEKDYITLILDEKIERTSQKQKVTDLVFGSLRHITAIDTVLEFFAKRRINHISTPLLSIIRIALYELIYCPDTPDYAIINDAVENTKSIAGKKQTAFVNAVLRQTARRITNRCITMNSLTAKNLLPQNMQTGCRFDSDFLPDASVDLPEYLHVCHSLPKWLISDWLGQFGKEKTQQICFASNRRPSVYLRPNTIKIQPKALLEKLQDQQICCELVCLDKKTYPKPTMIRLKSPQRIAELPGYAEGLFMIQDITASRVVTALAPGPGWRILDLCSAPGTKTAQIAEMTNDKAVIEATDINSERLKKVSENINRLGLKGVQIVEIEQFKQSINENNLYDAVLLDVPCSNTAVLAKRLEVRYKISRAAIKSCAKRQKELLELVSTLIKPTGKICYSTCSIQSDENDNLIKEFLFENPAFSIEYEELTLPNMEGFDHDGGYIAVLVKK